MDLSKKVLSDVIVFSKYAKYIPELKRRETWDEIVSRNMMMHMKKYPHMTEEISKAFQYVYEKKVLPSMRMAQFSGKPIEVGPHRGYNCSFVNIDTWETFHEIMFLLLGGTGVGYSVQTHHIEKLPTIKRPLKRKRRHLVADSIEGFSDAVKILMKAYFFNESDPVFDFSVVRPKGSPIKTSGGKAPGPQPLKDCLHNIRKVLDTKEAGSKLTSLEAHDIICHIADSVLSGGIRRSACLALFSLDDEDMMTCKFGNWWETNSQRGRANNSVMLLRHKVKKEDFFDLWKKVRESRSGEPGLRLSNNSEQGTNPCQPAWATVLTPNGIATIGSIKIGDTIWSGKQWTKVRDKWSTGVKKVFGFRTRAGVFYGTENHKVISAGERIEAGEAETIDTSQGPTNTSFLSVIDNESQNFVMDGLVIGDGSVHKASGNLVGLHIGQNDQDYFSDPICRLIKKHRPGVGSTFYEIQTSVKPDELVKTYERKIPDRYRFANEKAKCMFLRGLYSANGSVVSSRVTLKSASIKMIEDAQEMLSSLGIRSYYTVNKSSITKFKNGEYECKESYDLNISSDRGRFSAIIGFIQKYKTEKLNQMVNSTNKSKFANGKLKTSYEIISREFISEEEVFDLTVEADEHTYWTGGLLVSNCAEISLKSAQYCNLSTINVSDVESQQDLNERAKAAAFIGTLQAGYTDFHYIRESWKENTEKESLLGISMAGIASGNVLKLDLSEAAKEAKKENKRVAKLIGINSAYRLSCVKPEGSTSLLLGVSSGIHAWHSEYYIRRVTLMKNEPIYLYIKNKLPGLVEDDILKPHSQAFLKIPIKAPNGAITRSETAIDLLERVKKVYKEWIVPGHSKGDDTHNVSATVTVKEDEWDTVGEWMWNNRDYYCGLSVLPEDLGTYSQTPFEECTKEQYEELLKHVKDIDLSEVVEEDDSTDLKENLACFAGNCEVK